MPDGRFVAERKVALPALPIGRYRLIVDGVECALTVAPPEAYSPKAASRKRFGVAAQLYALRRANEHRRDQGIGDFSTLALAGESAGSAGAAYFGVSPLHMLFPRDRERASPYYPSDRRFLDPILIDALDGAGLPRDEAVDAALAGAGARVRGRGRDQTVEYEAVWRAKRAGARSLERGLRPVPRRAACRSARRRLPCVREIGRRDLRRFAAFQATAEGEAGENWRLWPQDMRDGEPKAIDKAIERNRQAFEFALFCQWLADRQLGRAAERARERGLEIGFYRDLAVGAAPDGAESWAHAAHLARGVTIGAPPDPFSAQGQNWNLPAPNPLAGAREGWASLERALPRQHAPRRDAAHRPRDGPRAPVPDPCGREARGGRLSLLSARRSHRPYRARKPARPLHGGRRGPRHRAGGLPRPDDARQHPGHAGFVVRARRPQVRPPQSYPPLSVACVATHDLATLAGWWRGADIAERLSLGLLTLARAGEEIARRREEKRGLIAALVAAGLIGSGPSEDAPLTDAIAAAVHALIGSAGSILAHAQFDDLVGETVQTNLPGTDRERPNWRLKVGPDVAAAFAGNRAQAILAALAKGRT